MCVFHYLLFSGVPSTHLTPEVNAKNCHWILFLIIFPYYDLKKIRYVRVHIMSRQDRLSIKKQGNEKNGHFFR